MKKSEKKEQAKVSVKYLGKKPSMPIYFPIGVKSNAGVEETKTVSKGGSIELSEDDAHALVAIDPVNFALEDGSAPKFKKSEIIPGARDPEEGESVRRSGEPTVAVPSGVEQYTPKPRK
jgi:hypothetical protein